MKDCGAREGGMEDRWRLENVVGERGGVLWEGEGLRMWWEYGGRVEDVVWGRGRGCWCGVGEGGGFGGGRGRDRWCGVEEEEGVEGWRM